MNVNVNEAKQQANKKRLENQQRQSAKSHHHHDDAEENDITIELQEMDPEADIALPSKIDDIRGSNTTTADTPEMQDIDLHAEPTYSQYPKKEKFSDVKVSLILLICGGVLAFLGIPFLPLVPWFANWSQYGRDTKRTPRLLASISLVLAIVHIIWLMLWTFLSILSFFAVFACFALTFFLMIFGFIILLIVWGISVYV